MSRIIISLIISLTLTITPVLEQLFEQFQGSLQSNSANNTLVADKPTEETSLVGIKDITQLKADRHKAQSIDNPVEIPVSKIVEEKVVEPQATTQEAQKNNADDEKNSSTGKKEVEAPVQAEDTLVSNAMTNANNGQNGTMPAGSSNNQTTLTDSPKVNQLPSNPEPITQNISVEQSGKVIDTSLVNAGMIGIRYLNQNDKEIKLLIEKDGTRYTYNLLADNSLESFPLQSGNGDYKISIMENIEGKRYKYVLTETVNVKINSANDAYLISIQMINWNSNMFAIKKAAELTAGVTEDEEKVKKIYNYVVSNINYDYNKLNNLPSTYLPVIDDTMNSKLGICYDFASLMAGMLRSVGVPTKLVMGYAEGVNGYHSWNEVYSDGKWIIIDTSYDSQMRENNGAYSMIKSSGLYESEKKY